MFRVSKKSDELLIEMHSDLQLIRQVDRPCAEFFGQYGIQPNSDVFLVLRELISNAIHHGNKGDLNRTVHVAIHHLKLPDSGCEKQPDHFTISVQDEGEGFDYQSQDLFMPEKDRITAKRGLKLVHALVDRLAFRDPGNCATVYLHFNPCNQ